MKRRPPRSALFPYTTLYRSDLRPVLGRDRQAELDPPGVPRPPPAGPVDRDADRLSGLEQTGRRARGEDLDGVAVDRKSTRLNSSHANISYAVFCLNTSLNSS